MMLFYNKDLFEKAGVTELPTADWTWEDMYRVAREITAAGQGEYYGYFPATWGAVYQPVLHAAGTELYDPATNRFTFAERSGHRGVDAPAPALYRGLGHTVPVGRHADRLLRGRAGGDVPGPAAGRSPASVKRSRMSTGMSRSCRS